MASSRFGGMKAVKGFAEQGGQLSHQDMKARRNLIEVFFPANSAV
jgi:hypothetical protein